MTPFDPDLRPDETPIEQDDLIAFHLHELPRQKTRAIHRALRNNPNLQAESLAIATTLRAFPQHEPALPLDAAALDRHWRALQPSLPIHTAPPIAPPSPFFRWAIPAAAGSVLVTTALFVALHHGHHTQPPTIATSSSTTSSPTLPTSPQPEPPSNTQPNPFTARPQRINRAWSPSSAPVETATAIPAPTLFHPQTPTPLTPTNPSTNTTATSSTAPTPLPPSNATQTQPPEQPSTPAAIQPGRSLRTSAHHRSPATELTLAMFGNITAGRSSSYTSVFGTSQITQTATPAVGALASFGQQFRPRLGYRLTATYFSPSFNYFNGLDIRHQIYELSATYVAQGPHHRRLTTSVEAGASVLNFRYRDDYISPTPPTIYSTYRPAAVVGVGAEYAISKHWGLRAEYRALVYRPPSVANPGDTSIAPTTDLTFSSNPILGITYRFGANGAD